MFEDRIDAGRRLAVHLLRYQGDDVVVLGLPRGGVPVAAEVARALGAPLDVIVVRKLGLPQQPEVAMGAVGEGGVEVLDTGLVGRARVSPRELDAVEARERAVVSRRASELRRGRPPMSLAGRVALVVDDGVATGSTARAACKVARALGAARVVVAVPVAPSGLTARDLVADELVCVEQPEHFQAVGQHYWDFTPTTDRDVMALLTGASGADVDEAGVDEAGVDEAGVDEAGEARR